MKSISFQRNKSLIRVVNEEKIKKSRNWDRLIYLILLALFLFFMAYYIVHRSLYVRANGQVLLESLNIRLTEDARILAFNVSEGDSVRVNDTLFAYATGEKKDGNGGTGISIGSGGGEGDSWWWKEAYNLKKKISLNTIEIGRNSELLQSYRSEVRRITNEVILDVLPKSRLDQLKGEVTKLVSENEKLQKENAQLSQMISELGPASVKSASSSVRVEGGGSNSGNRNARYNFSGEYLSEPRFFLSPIEGIITRLYLHQYETALKSEPVVSMHKNYNLTIKAFFDQENLQEIREGDIFKIEFPDGTISMGVLKRFYFATYAMPEEFQKKYEPTTRAISADIFPLNDEEAKKWKAFYKMSVEISKFKY
jgi:hypothetical protein